MNNIIPLVQPPAANLNDDILAELGSKRARDIDIDLYDVIDLVDLNQNYSKVRDWLIKERITTKYEWNQALAYKKRKDALGANVTTVTEYMHACLKQTSIFVDYKQRINEMTRTIYKGEDVGCQLDKVHEQLEKATNVLEIKSLENTKRLLENILQCKAQELSVDDIARRMRIKARELGLNFSAMDIDDVLHTWLKEQKSNRKTELFTYVSHQRGLATGPLGQEMWLKLANGLFNTEDKSAEFCIGVLKKYMWQVKRKILNEPVTNHLMPILLGPQGVGKTTFLNKMLAPLKEMVAATDFSQITDDRNIDLWDNFALVLDEMGYATKADIDIVKNLVTSQSLTRRIMRTNHVVHVKQNASFIGASNREIEQIIRDETGARRFIGIRFKNEPNFAVMNEIDYDMLWQSVDEHGPDPLEGFQEVLKVAQEEIRVTNSTEEWIESLPKSFINKEYGTSELYREFYRPWEKEHYTKRTQDYGEFCKELNRLINNNDQFPMKREAIDRKIKYRYTGKPVVSIS